MVCATRQLADEGSTECNKAALSIRSDVYSGILPRFKIEILSMAIQCYNPH